MGWYMRKLPTITPSTRKLIWASVVGNALELYDYSLYGYFAAILASQFFPSEDPVSSLLATYGVFASGFILRPLGGIFFGNIGDRFGRKVALQISILLMALPTFCIGCLPNYSQVGLLAPILLTFLRLLQGVSVGGELVGSYAFLSEHAPANQKGFMGAWNLVGCFGGKLLGTVVSGGLSFLMAPALLQSYGWRIPFLSGIIFVLLGFYIRKQITETPIFKKMAAEKTTSCKPVREALTEAPGQILRSAGAGIINTTSNYVLFIFFPVFLVTQFKLSYAQAMISNFLSLLLCLFLLPLAGHLSDLFGRRIVQLAGIFALIALIYPAFIAISWNIFPITCLAQMTLAICYALLYGPFPAFLSELFPDRIRYTGSAIGYNLTVALFGGLTPLIATWLIKMFESPFAPAVWVIVSGLVSLITIYFAEETRITVRNQSQSPLTTA